MGIDGFTDWLDMSFKIQLIVYNYSQILHFRYLFNKLPINLYIQKLCESFLMEKQTEFFLFIFLLKVKQDEYSQDDILSKLAFSLSATEVLVLPDAYTTVSSACIYHAHEYCVQPIGTCICVDA